VVATIARALLEIEAGDRPSGQLERVCHPTLWQVLDRRLPRDGGPRITCDSLRRVLVQQHRPGLVDGWRCCSAVRGWSRSRCGWSWQPVAGS
jgi:hypothetical protein